MTQPSVTNAPLLFLRICRAWRDVALATPQVWASIQISPVSSCFDTELSRQQLRNWLIRADVSPLSMVLQPPLPYRPSMDIPQDLHWGLVDDSDNADLQDGGLRVNATAKRLGQRLAKLKHDDAGYSNKS